MNARVVVNPAPIEEKPLEPAEPPVPEPGPGEVRIRVNVCGACRTDLHIAEGDLPPRKSPLVPGHQAVGGIDALGDGVARFKGGERVGVTWLYSACGRCNFCGSGRENLCDDALFTGYDRDGGYAEYMVIPESYAHPIPEGFPDVQAAPLLCAGVIGYRSSRLSEVRPGERLGLHGFGASAHVTIQIARHLGCEVYVFTRSDSHRRHALELGAVWAGAPGDDPSVPLDSGIIFAPAGTVVHDALRVLKKGGVLAINAVHMTPIPELPYSLIYHERTIRSVANCTRRDAEELLRLAAEIPIRTDVELFPLSEANEVLLRMKRSEIRGAAVLEIRG